MKNKKINLFLAASIIFICMSNGLYGMKWLFEKQYTEEEYIKLELMIEDAEKTIAVAEKEMKSASKALKTNKELKNFNSLESATKKLLNATQKVDNLITSPIATSGIKKSTDLQNVILKAYTSNENAIYSILTIIDDINHITESLFSSDNHLSLTSAKIGQELTKETLKIDQKCLDGKYKNNIVVFKQKADELYQKVMINIANTETSNLQTLVQTTEKINVNETIEKLKEAIQKKDINTIESILQQANPIMHTLKNLKESYNSAQEVITMLMSFSEKTKELEEAINKLKKQISSAEQKNKKATLEFKKLNEQIQKGNTILKEKEEEEEEEEEEAGIKLGEWLREAPLPTSQLLNIIQQEQGKITTIRQAIMHQLKDDKALINNLSTELIDQYLSITKQ